MSTRTSTTSVRIPGDLLDRFDRLAKATERTRSYHVIKALEAYIAEQDYLFNLFAEATAEADADPTTVSNADAAATIESAVASIPPFFGRPVRSQAPKCPATVWMPHEPIA